MTPSEALKLLGSVRVIWIDDRFAEASATLLAQLLTEHAEELIGLCPDEIQGPLRKILEDDSTGNDELAQAVEDLSVEQQTEILRKAQSELEKAGTEELSDKQIKCVCSLLNIPNEDCWDFENAETKMLELANNRGDSEVTYIIDLNDARAGHGNTRGLELLKTLYAAGSQATAMLLTHYATKSNESEKELELRDVVLGAHPSPNVPLCVIAKERLYPEEKVGEEANDEVATVATALRIAIKRAGLRRNVHEVLVRLQGKLQDAFNLARGDLLEVPPEQLDEYVIGRAYSEGVSELHVVERALTASMSESFRLMFSTDSDTRENERRLRSLRDVKLDLNVTNYHRKLETFRTREVWETSELVNKGCSPLACGDVFEMDGHTSGDMHRFILLVQPCDVTLRPNGERDSDDGFLVMLKQLESGSPNQKQIGLPFLLEGKQWVCELRKSTAVRLNLLDLASFRDDGRLQYNVSQSLPNWLLPGQQARGKSIFASLKCLIDAQPRHERQGGKVIKDPKCQLTFLHKGPFQHIAQGTYVEAKTAQGEVPMVGAGVTWNLRRIGRVRMPYASALLGNYLAIVDRDAFDLDYLKPRQTIS